jgi:hypothetical protein
MSNLEAGRHAVLTRDLQVSLSANNSDLYSGKFLVRISPGTLVTLTEKFRRFPQSLRENFGTVYSIRPRPASSSAEIGTSSIDWFLPEDGARIQSVKRCVLKYKQDGVFR